MNRNDTDYSAEYYSNNALGDTLKKYRKTSGLSQDQAAYELIMSRSTYAKLETGDRMPTLSQLIKMSKLYGVSLQELISPLEDTKEKEVVKEASEYLAYKNEPDLYSLTEKLKKLDENEKSYVAKLMDIFIDGH